MKSIDANPVTSKDRRLAAFAGALLVVGFLTLWSAAEPAGATKDPVCSMSPGRVCPASRSEKPGELPGDPDAWVRPSWSVHLEALFVLLVVAFAVLELVEWLDPA